MRQGQMTLPGIRFGVVQIGIVVLTLITALFHLHLATNPTEDLRLWFLLNGIGYIVLLVALYLPQLAYYQRFVRYLLMAYALATIICWFILARPYDIHDVPIKIDEMALLCLLFVEDVQRRAYQLDRE